MELTTAMTRDFATVAAANGGPPNVTVRTLNGSASKPSKRTICDRVRCFPQMPLYDWDATTGKQYSLLFVELMRPGSPRRSVIHYFAYNVCNGTAVTKDLDTTLGGWRAPTHGRVGSLGLYVHYLFQHEAGLAFNLSAAMRIAGSDAATDLATFMATVGLDNATLVSMNWMAVRGSILSRTAIGADRWVFVICHMHFLLSFAECNVAPIWQLLQVQRKLCGPSPQQGSGPTCTRYVRHAHRYHLLRLPAHAYLRQRLKHDGDPRHPCGSRRPLCHVCAHHPSDL
jgi:hypothetical protein